MNKRQLIKYGLGVVAWFAFAGVSGAQEEGEEPAAVRGRKAWFLTVGMPEGMANPVDILVGGKVQQVALSKRSMSGPVKIPADGIIKIVKTIPNPEDPSEVTYLTLASAKISESMSEAMVIFAPSGKKPGEGLLFGTKVLDLKGFRGGDFLYMNLSPRKVAVTLGEKKLTLAPGDLEVLEARDLKKSKNVPTSYHFYAEDKKRWRLLSASTVVMHTTRREICIFSWDPRMKRLDYHGVTFPVVVD